MNIISKQINILQGDSIKAKSARGMIKLGTGTGVERIMRLVRTMILTRILAPEQFGLMAIILAIVNVFEQMSEVGIKLSIVQHKRGSEYEYLNSTWWFQAVRGLGLFAVALLVAPWVSSFFGKPHLLGYLQVALLAIIFRGFISPRAHALRREFKFGLMVLHVQGSAFLGTIITVVFAFVLRDIWALVIGYVAENFFLCFLSYIVAPFKPRLGMDRNCLKELTAFARGMFGVPSLSLIAFATPTFVLGKIVTEEQLGWYVLAGQLVSIPLDFYNKIVSPVLLPGFAKRQDDKVSLNNAVLRISELLAAVSLPLVGFMMVCAPALMLFLWGPRYIDATIPCVLLCLLIIARTQGSVLSSIYVAVGRPYLQRRYVILMTSIIVLLIYPAVVYGGLAGAAMTSVLGSFVALFMQIVWCRRVIPLDFETYIKSYIPGLLISFLPLITVLLLVLSGSDSLAVIVIAAGCALIAAYMIYFGKIFFGNSKISLAVSPAAKKVLEMN